MQTVPLARDGVNVATFWMSPGYSSFHAYCSETQSECTAKGESDPITIMQVQEQDPNFLTDDKEPDKKPAKGSPASGWGPYRTYNKAHRDQSQWLYPRASGDT